MLLNIWSLRLVLLDLSSFLYLTDLEPNIGHPGQIMESGKIRHENCRRHGRHAWGTTLMELRNQISLLPRNCCFCLTLVWLHVRQSIWGCLYDISSCMWPQFEAATMILPHWCNLKVKILTNVSPKRPIFTRHFEEPKRSQNIAWGTNRHNSHVCTSYQLYINNII